MWVHVCMCGVCEYVCEHVCTKLRGRSQAPALLLPGLFLRDKVSQYLGWLSASPHDPPVSGPYHTKITTICTDTHGVLHVCWDLKSRCHLCTASTLTHWVIHLSSSHIYTHFKSREKMEPSNEYIESKGISILLLEEILKKETSMFLRSIQLFSAHQISGGARAPELPLFPGQLHAKAPHPVVTHHDTQQPGRNKTLEAYN